MAVSPDIVNAAIKTAVDRMFPDFSGPLMVGAGYSSALRGEDESAVVSFGLGAMFYAEPGWLAQPDVMVAIDCQLYLHSAMTTTIEFSVHRNVWRLMTGLGAGLSVRDSAGNLSDVALVISPQLSFPLRVHVRDGIEPTALVFARVDVPMTGRDGFGEQVLTGVSLVLP